MELSFDNEIKKEISKEIKPEIKANVRELIGLTLQLRHPEFKNALTGIEGLKKANQIMLDRDCVGILIGGVAEELFKKSFSLDKINKHKDVDVIGIKKFTGSFFKPELPFEEGIDWWYFEKDKQSDLSYIRNSNGIILPYELSYDIYRNYYACGLHLLNVDSFIKSKFIESNAFNKKDKVKFDFNVFLDEYKEIRQIDDEINKEKIELLKKAGLDIDTNRIIRQEYFKDYSEEELISLKKIEEKIKVEI